MNDFLSEVFNPAAGWSWLLTLIGVTGFYFAGKKKWWCWYINIANQALWVAYSLITEQWGFLLGCAIYSWVFGRNALEWTRDHFASPSKKLKTVGDEFIGEVVDYFDRDENIQVRFRLNERGIEILKLQQEQTKNEIDVPKSLHFYPAGYCWRIVDGLLCGKEECDEVHMVKDGHDYLSAAPILPGPRD